MSHKHFLIPPPRDAAGETTLNQSLAEYYAHSSNEDDDYSSIDRAAVVEFPSLPNPFPQYRTEASTPFFFLTADITDEQAILCLWVHLPELVFVIGSATRTNPRFTVLEEGHPFNKELPPEGHLQELFDAIFSNPELLFPLYEQPASDSEQSSQAMGF